VRIFAAMAATVEIGDDEGVGVFRRRLRADMGMVMGRRGDGHGEWATAVDGGSSGRCAMSGRRR
jgi:hypothetical protein